MASSRYGSRTLVYVPIGSDASVINYGFNTNMDAGDQTKLGHVQLNYAAVPQRLVLGANRPKPGRASKRSALEYSSSFYDASKAATLRTDGWRLSFPKFKSGKGDNGVLSKEYYVTLDGIKYAWSLPNAVALKIGESQLSALGLSLTQINDSDYVFGARFPKPPRASKVTIGDNGKETVSTFFDPSRTTLPDGFIQTKSGITTLSL